jgi:hypothetical protein
MEEEKHYDESSRGIYISYTRIEGANPAPSLNDAPTGMGT